MLADENLLEDDVFWALADHLGTVRRLVDNAGNAIRDRIFSAWGQVIEDTNPTFAYPFAFTGREFDPETGLYYYRARYYDPHTGRFLSEDPLGFQAGDTNLSRYVFNSPLNYTDPSGMAWSWPLAAAGGAIGAGVAVIGYGIGAWLSGHEVTWKGAAAAAAGGFTAGFITGGIVGAATGDPTALIGAGALAGLAGAGVQSALHQYLENGTVNWTQVLVDMMFGAALGAISGGVSSLLPGAGQAVRSSADDLFWPGGSMALALPGGGAVPAVAPVAGGLSPAAQSQLLGGLTAFSVGLQGGSGPEEHPPSPDPHDKGAAREQRVAKLVGGKVVRKKVKVKGLPSTDIDVLGPNGEFIEVGGPAKAKLSTFGKQLQSLKKAAEENGVPALVYLEEGTPQAAIDLAIRWLGKSNVKIFKP